MAVVQEQILCEILCPRAKTGGKADIVSTFKTIFAISNQAALSSSSPPSLGLRVFGNVKSYPEEAGLFLFWRSMEHHDGLSQTPGFEPAAKMFGEKIVPNLETPLSPCYMWTRQVEIALRDATCCEGTGLSNSPRYLHSRLTGLLVIEVHFSGSEDAEELGTKFVAGFDSLKLPEGFLGYFYGPKYDDSNTFVIVTKWSSEEVMADNEWAQNIEKCILDAFGRRSSIEKRQQMYV